MDQDAGAAADPLIPEERVFIAAQVPIRFASDPPIPPFGYPPSSGVVGGIPPAISPLLRNALLILVLAVLLSVVWIAVLRRNVRRAMKSLRESEEKFRTVADYTYDWETWVAPDRSMLYVSPSCECITGYRAEEFAGDPGLLHRIVHPEDRPWFDVHIRDCLEGVKQGEEHEESEFRIVRSDGELRWIGHVCTPVFGVDGTFRGRRGSNRDITERKRSEREKALLQSRLQETTKQLGLSMDAAELGVWEWDVPSDQFTIGEHFSRALGYTDNAIVHHGVLDEGVSFIGKPYSPWALAKKIREVLDKT